MSLDLPSAVSVQKQSKGVVIRVDRKSQVFFDGKRVAESDIKRLVAKRMEKNPKTSVVLHADRLTPYSQVIRILDSVRLGGCFRIVLEAKKQA